MLNFFFFFHNFFEAVQVPDSERWLFHQQSINKWQCCRPCCLGHCASFCLCVCGGHNLEKAEGENEPWLLPSHCRVGKMSFVCFPFRSN